MKSIPAISLIVGCIVVLCCLDAIQAQEPQPVVVKSYEDEFIFYSGSTHSINVSLHPTDDVVRKNPSALDAFSITLKSLPADLRELPEFKLEYQGTKYVVPARKVIVVAPEPKTQGIYVQAALDPNGTGNYEVMLTIRWDDWPDEDKKIEFLSRLMPESLEVVSNSAGWSRSKGGLYWTGTLIFHNRTGRPFVLDAGYFENLPTTEGWPVIEIPSAD